MEDDVVRQVEEFLEKNRSKYQLLVDQIRGACETVKYERKDAIRRVYGRDEKQDGAKLTNISLKAPAKVAKKWRDDFGCKVAISEVFDIAGLTAVVYYSDQINSVIEAVKAHLAKSKARIECGPPKPKRDAGYFATHVIFTSKNAKSHIGLKCELQVKTMLHDAWSAKTHDLTYKPSVQNDSRMTRMMNAISNSIESIEAQSELLRELIHERWNADKLWRIAIRQHLFTALPSWVEKELFGEEGAAIRQAIEAGTDRLKADDEEFYQEISGRIHELCLTSLREGHLLQAYVALVRENQDDLDRAIERTMSWLGRAIAEWKAKRAKAYEVWSIPLVLQACGDLTSAISVGRKLYAQRDEFEAHEQYVIAFNLANHLIEDSYFAFPWREKELVGEMKKNYEAVRSEIFALAEFAEPLRKEDDTPFLDFDGLAATLFATDTAQARRGIDLITQGNQGVPESDRKAAQAFYELHIRMAWRRMLDMETYAAI